MRKDFDAKQKENEEALKVLTGKPKPVPRITDDILIQSSPQSSYPCIYLSILAFKYPSMHLSIHL